MRHLGIVGLVTLLLSTSIGPAAHAELRGAAAPRIEWEVKNRFRLFRSEADFQRHVASWRNDGVLGSEQRLAIEQRVLRDVVLPCMENTLARAVRGGRAA